MVLMFKSLLQRLSSNDILLATTKFGDVKFVDNMLIIPCFRETFKYDFNKDKWIVEINRTIYDATHAPYIEVDNEELTVYDNRFFEFILGDHVVEYYSHVRANRCFPIINRGKLWYEKLSASQIDELTDWYDAWLDVTETLTYPVAPSWLNNKLRKYETEEIY